MSNSVLNQFKSGIKNGIKVTLKISSNVVADSNDENNFTYKFTSLIHKFQGFVKLLQIIPQLM